MREMVMQARLDKFGKARVSAAVAAAAFLALLVAGCGGGSGDALLEAGMTRLVKGDNKGALRKLEGAVQKLPESATAWCNLGIAQWKLGQNEQAAASFKRASELEPNNPLALEFLGQVLIQLKKYDEARDTLAKAGEFSPNSPRIYTALGVVEFEAGQNGLADARWKQALSLDPNCAPALYNLGCLYRDRMNSKDEATRSFEKYVQVAGNDAHVKSAKNFLEEKPVKIEPPQQPQQRPQPLPPVERGGVVTEQPLKQKPISPLIMAVKKAVEKQSYDEALELLKQAIKKDPGNPDALWELAVLYDKNLKYADKANQTYRKFRQLFPNDPRVTVNTDLKPDLGRPPPPPVPSKVAVDRRMAQESFSQGLKLYNAKNWDGAIASYKHALEFDNDSTDILFNLGLAYKAKGDLQKAKDAFIHVLKVDPNMVRAGYMLAVVYRELKDSEQAIEQLNKVLNIQPDYADGQCLMGFLYIDKGKPDLARKRFERYLQLEPKGESAKQVREWLQKKR